ncbi:MAG: thiolase family protein [Gammaproteobacteria bacterium]
MARGYDSIVLTTPISFGYSKFSENSSTWFAGNVLRQMLTVAGVDKAEIDGLSLSSFSLAPDTAPSVVESLGLTLKWLATVPYGGASGVIAAKRAARTVQCGDADVVACIAADTLRPNDFKNLVANFSNATKDASYPYTGGGPNLAFALMTQAYMEKYGITRQDFAQISVEQRYNANHYQPALLGHKTLSTDEYLAARAVVEPLHLYDCVMPCAGADGFLVMREERAKSLGLDSVSIASAFECFNAFPHDEVQMRAGWSIYGEELFANADVQHGDIDLLETYDDYPVVVMMQLEGMGFCAPGTAASFLRQHSMKFDAGGLPHNTNGGQLSVGQAGAAGGFVGIVEALRQLLGLANNNQVAAANIALITGFGMVNYDRGLCSSAMILKSNNS